jgi:ATPase subunit of ABC transporter with duplicated ATPase domains
VAAEQEAARRLVRTAAADVQRQRRELRDARVKLDRRRRYGQKMWDTKREPKIIMGARKRQAEVAAGKHRGMHLEKLEQARERLAEAEDAVHDDDEIRVELPGTAVPAGRTVLAVHDARLRGGARVELEVRGPERIALLGPNGAGKTTLLETVVGTLDPLAGTVTAAVPLRYLPQRLDVLEDAAGIAANVARFAPGASDNAIRARLARFLFRGARADQPVGTLSGGERFRATLAALLLAEPPPQLLLLDEPTNNLDMASSRQLAQALAAYRGALLVASHDLAFLAGIGITRWLRLDGRLTEIDPP